MDSAAPHQLWDAVEAIHYVYPSFIFIYFFVATAVSICTLQTMDSRAKNQVRRDILLSLMSFVVLSYIIEAFTIGIYDAIHRTWSGEHDYNIYILSSIIVWAILAINLSDSKVAVWYPYLVPWVVGMLSELVLVIVSNILQPPKIWLSFTSITLQAVRICAFGLLICLYAEFRTRKEDYDNEDPERQSLLRRKFRPKTSTSTYGTVTTTSINDEEAEDPQAKKLREAREKLAARLEKEGNWFAYAKGFFRVFSPLIFPFRNKQIQARTVGVALCLVSKSLLNVLLPIQFGLMAESLLDSSNSWQGPWVAAACYALLSIINSSCGVGGLQNWLWLKVDINAYEALSTASFTHVMNLSSDFHDNKSSAEVYSAIQQGKSVKDLVEIFVLELIPMIVDLCVAFVYLYFLFGHYMALVSFAAVVTYLAFTTTRLARRRSLRRDFVRAYKKERTIGSDGLDAWQNAVYFNRIPYETQRYEDAVKDMCRYEVRYLLDFYLTWGIQGSIITLGLLSALYIAIYEIVVLKTKSVGDFITLVDYWRRLIAPLSSFSTMYRNISNYMLDAERLLELFETKPTVFDSPNAKPLEISQGSVTFHGIKFAYGLGKTTINNVSFHVPGGSTVALVGETGGGKSTMLKLLSRFYDVNEGSIEIDGQDIREVTLASLRESIGSVPQDPQLFNDTIMSNVRYAKLDAEDEEIYEACKGAAVHDKIMGFSNGYNSKVGDNGVKLSGGERQRVAIARAILKNSRIILLDEATSAVDTETESRIQEALSTLCRGHTTFIVAHRLATVLRADLILVVQDGTIIEKGSHIDLIKKRGKYHDLWSRQIFVMEPEDPEQSASSKKPLADIANVASKEIIESLKLKPEAPEFVPRSVGASLDDPDKSGDTPKEEDQDTEQQASVASESAKKADKRVHRIIELEGEGSQSSPAKPSGSENKGDENQGPASNTKAKNMKRSRPARRRQSKSEPTTEATSAQAQESIRRTMDGMQATEWTGNGSGDGLLPLSPAPARSGRRVSAPSDTPPNPVRDLRGASRGGRARRPRHWRLRKHSHDPSLPMSASESTSGSGSAEYSTPAGVTAPVPTPAEAPLLPIPRIRFAPGC